MMSISEKREDDLCKPPSKKSPMSRPSNRISLQKEFNKNIKPKKSSLSSMSNTCSLQEESDEESDEENEQKNNHNFTHQLPYRKYYENHRDFNEDENCNYEDTSEPNFSLSKLAFNKLKTTNNEVYTL